MKIDFQNENLIATIVGDDGDDDVGSSTRGRTRVVATVPDLISIVDLSTGRPIFTDENRFGLRVAVLGN